MTWRGAFTGALLLIALEAVVRTSQSAERVGSFFELGGDVVRRVMSPAVPLIPDTRSTGVPDSFGNDYKPPAFDFTPN